MPSKNSNIGWTDNEDVQERFWEKVDKETGSGCWEWTGASNERGYGRVRINDTLRYAHRAAHQFENGPLENSPQVNHHCDNPACVRPDHLYAGDQKENIADAIEHGDLLKSRARGQEHGKSVLDEEQVREIRRLYDSGEHSQRDLSNRFDVSKGAIQDVVEWKTWTHLDDQGGESNAN